MNTRNVLTVYHKELRDLLRDRRTIISMIVVPTLVIPVLMFVAIAIGAKVVRQARAETPAVVLLGAEHSPRVQAVLAGFEKIRLVPPRDDWRDAIANKEVRAAVEVPPGFEAALARGEPARLSLYHYEGELKSGFALRELRDRLNALREELVGERLAARGVDRAVIEPFTIASTNVAPPEKVGGNAFGGFLPYIFIILCFTGAMYPAMDLTAGEKERGTMETILCSPIARLDLVLGKFLMVLTASLATVAFSLTSLVGSFAVAGLVFAPKLAAGAAGAPRGGVPLPSLDPAGVLGVVAMILPLAVVFAALLLALSLVAKSYKEATSYVSPLIVVIILPAMMGMMPGIELNAKLALVPVLNLSLVSKEMVSGVFNWHYIALIFGSSCAYAAAALAFCVWMFKREDVIFRT